MLVAVLKKINSIHKMMILMQKTSSKKII